MKKIVSLLLCLVLLMTAVGALAQAFTPGTYSATVPGRNGDLTVEMTFDEGSILSVAVTAHQETAGIADPAIAQIPERILAGQTLAVDTIAGATITADAILAAAADCVVQAGGDPAAMTAVQGEAEAVENKETQVLVVGTGIAGLMAAHTAKDAGADVILIDKMAITGGTTRISGGYIISVGSDFTAEGAINTTEDMLAYWKSIADQCRDTGYPDYDRVASIFNGNNENIHYLKSAGVPLGDQAFAGGYALMHSDGNGVGMVDALEASAREKGIEIILECKAEELITEGEAVVGVRATKGGQSFEIRAKSVVLATGGYSQNPELVARFAPELLGTIPTASVSNTGDGILMAEAVGAAVFENGWFSICPMQVSNEYLMQGGAALTTNAQLGVNSKGERYAAEMDQAFSYELTYKTILDGVDPHYFIYDSANADLTAVLEAGIALGEVVKGDTVEALAEQAGIDAAALKATFDAYNEMAAKGEDTQYGKAANYMIPLTAAPYYMVKIYPASWGSMGGVKTDIDTAAVLRADGTAIPGLYAAGEMSNRVFYNEVYYGAASLTVYSNMGRRAGIAAAAYAK